MPMKHNIHYEKLEIMRSVADKRLEGRCRIASSPEGTGHIRLGL